MLVPVCLHVVRHRAGDPEIGDDGVAVLVEQDVVDLDVAVDDAFAVGEAERARDVDAHADEHRLGQLGDDLEAVGQSLGQEVHGEVHGVAVFADREDLDDVGVAEPGGGRGLAAEALLELLVAGVLGLEDLERDRDLELGVERLVDPREATRADDRIDAELAERAP